MESEAAEDSNVDFRYIHQEEQRMYEILIRQNELDEEIMLDSDDESDDAASPSWYANITSVNTQLKSFHVL